MLPRLLVSILCAAAFATGCSDPGYKGRSSDQWIATLKTGSTTERVDAVFALGHVLEVAPGSRKVTRALVSALRDTADDVRVAAATGLRRAGPLAVRAIPLLGDLLADTAHADVRERAAVALGDVGRNAPQQATELLRRGMADQSPSVRTAAARALGGLGGGARAAIPELIEAAKAGDPQLRLASIDALARIGMRTRMVTETFVAALRDSSADVRRAAALGVDRVMTASPELVDALIVAARDRNSRVRVAAVYALGMIGDTTANGALREALSDGDSTVRREAAHALSAFHQTGGRDSLREP